MRGRGRRAMMANQSRRGVDGRTTPRRLGRGIDEPWTTRLALDGIRRAGCPVSGVKSGREMCFTIMRRGIVACGTSPPAARIIEPRDSTPIPGTQDIRYAGDVPCRHMLGEAHDAGY